MITNDKNNEVRLDSALVERGLAGSRERAKKYILSGEVLLNGKVTKKASTHVLPEDILKIEGKTLRYVGRGGLKLEKALTLGGYDLAGVTALDIGASTGGFTDCLLQHGANRVYAIDVGHGQLHSQLKTDSRVVDLEGTDIRDIECVSTRIPFSSAGFCCIDVSFISVTKLFDSVLRFLKPDASIVCLIKPQFEAGRAAIGKNGIVKAADDHKRVIREMCSYFESRGCAIKALSYSPITGGSGNIEYLSLLEYGNRTESGYDIDILVKEAFLSLK